VIGTSLIVDGSVESLVWRELGGMGGFAKRWRRRKEQGDREKELNGL
jgi:hypothetical protein